MTLPSAPSPMPHSQLLWACRRGMLELDLIFERYCQNALGQSSSTERAAFEALLSCQDQDLYDWLIKRQSSPPELSSIIEVLLQ
jgi:succinate dehydrogenase flavin-adding protein (antitoxin of CptAB toxin-antitoxin module)